MFMQAGFALVETGLTRAKNVAHTMGMNFLVYAIGIIGFWALGFGLQMGGVGALSTFGNDATLSSEFVVHIAGKDFGLFGMKGFFLTPAVYTSPVAALFLFQMVFMDTTATIPTGRDGRALAVLVVRRLQLRDRIDHLSDLRATGFGAAAGCPSSGRTSVSATGTSTSRAARSCTWSAAYRRWSGRRCWGRASASTTPDGKARPIPGHNIPMAVLGHVHPRVRLVRLQPRLDAVGHGHAHRRSSP